jgi:hypothetical protein
MFQNYLKTKADSYEYDLILTEAELDNDRWLPGPDCKVTSVKICKDNQEREEWITKTLEEEDSREAYKIVRVKEDTGELCGIVLMWR